MTLTPDQRLSILAALPTIIGGTPVLVFEDDGGGWHNDPTVESWVSFSVLAEGARSRYNVRSLLVSEWNPVTQQWDDERGQIDRGTLNLYVCSTSKATVQAYVSELARLIEFSRLGLSLDDQGVVTGPQDTTIKALGSYNDFRLKKRVYRTLIEIPVEYKFSEIETGYPIKTIGIQPWVGPETMKMGEELIHRAPIILTADGLMAAEVQPSLTCDLILSGTATALSCSIIVEL